MRKTFNKRRKIIKNKNRKTKKHMKGGIGDLGEHVFIGYKKLLGGIGSAGPIDIPIIVPKNIRNYSSGFFELPNLAVTHPLDDMKNYTIYLSQLNKLTNIDYKMNLYGLIMNGIKFIDENDEKIFYHDKYTESPYFYKVSKLSEYISSKKRFDNYGKENNPHKRDYETKIIEVKKIFDNDPEFKRMIQDLEYRYQGIIEPILLTDEASIYNYANGPEPSISERIDRTSRVLEEGLKKI